MTPRIFNFRSRKWVIASRRADLEGKPAEKLWGNNTMCEYHFEPICFRKTKALKRKLLTKDAVPTIFNGITNAPPKLQVSRPKTERQYVQRQSATTPSCSDSLEVEIMPETPQMKYLKRKLSCERSKSNRLRKKITRLSEDSPSGTLQLIRPDQELTFLQETLGKHLPAKASNFVLTQIRISKLPKYGRRWTFSEKSFALTFFHTSRKAYRLLSTIFAMPSPSTLSVAMHNINIRPGICTHLMQLFNIKVKTMNEHEKLCALLVDEIALKKTLNYDPTNDEIEGLEDYGSLGRTHNFADHALVFMIRGLSFNWKQPIGYFLTKGATKAKLLQNLVFQVIKEVFNLGLKLKVNIYFLSISHSLTHSLTPSLTHSLTHSFTQLNNVIYVQTNYILTIDRDLCFDLIS